MQKRLASLGFAIPLEPIPHCTQLTSDDLHEIESIAGTYVEDDGRIQESQLDYTVGRSAHTTGHHSSPHDRPLKRQRVDSPLPSDMQIDIPSSRDMMPPPAKPLSRMRSVRGLLPKMRKKFSSNHSSQRGPQINGDGARLLTDKQIRASRAGPEDQERQVGGSHHINAQDSEAHIPYMTGALPTEGSSEKLRVFGKRRTEDDTSEFSFRAASPVKMSDRKNLMQTTPLSAEPSYLHLMDGLSNNNNVDFSLRDPRDNVAEGYGISDIAKPSNASQQNQHRGEEFPSQRRWRFGNPFLHQSPGDSTGQSNTQRITPLLTSPKGFFTRAHYDPSVSTATTISPQHQNIANQNVVSSFFGGRQHGAYTAPRPSNTETQTSSHPSIVSQSQTNLIAHNSSELRRQSSTSKPSLNKSLQGAQHTPISGERHWQAPPHDFTQGYSELFVRNVEHNLPTPSYTDNSNYASPRRAIHEVSHQRGTWIPSPASRSNSALCSRIGRVPSKNPPFISRYSDRNPIQWDTPPRMGVRSTRQSFGNMKGTMIESASAHPALRTKRRSVQRSCCSPSR